MGQFDGMLMERAYTIELLQEGTPQTVTVNGVQTSDWRVDNTTGSLIISVPVTACDQKLVINIVRAATGIHEQSGKSMVKRKIYDLQGNLLMQAPNGPYIERNYWSDGSVTTRKHIKK